MNDLWRKDSVIKISRTSKTIQLGFKMQASGSVWRDKPLWLKGLNFTLKIEQLNISNELELSGYCCGSDMQVKHFE